uniref:Calcineurin-like phosphoesterase n=1 Tax=Candidatus Kentrum sp. FW TaxID=2126338 RepID=A0A450T727_9GAMM|nr:MAG: Calcineurin-like phosphoesterase [Candidatus Kentron sp. FW]
MKTESNTTKPKTPSAPGSSITWLHLSDLHLCAPKTGWDADRILKFLVEDLQRMEADHGLSPDLLLVTGDLAFGHLGEGDLSIESQFKKVAEFLEDVRVVFSKEIPNEHVFLVPGNHDVDRRKVRESQTEWLDNLANKPDPVKFVDQMLNDASGEWPGLMERLAVYRQFLQEHYPHLLPDEDAEKRLCYTRTLDINGHRLGIAGLNSAWSCGRDGEKGKLWLGGQWQSNTLSGKCKDAEIKLLLAHHPLNWLVEQETPKLNQRLEQAFHFFLHGHEHFSWVDEKKDHIRLSAGACYGETPAESGYSFVRLDPEAGKGQVWLRRFDETGLGWIPRVIPGSTDNNGLWPLDLGWSKGRKGASVGWGERSEPQQGEPKQGQPQQGQPQQDDPQRQETATQASHVGVRPEGSPQPTDPIDPAPDAPESRGVFGRGQEIEKLTQKLRETPILLVHGMAGIGKSYLIEEVHRALGHVRPGGGKEYKLVSLRATVHLGADEIFGQLAPVLKCFDDDPRAPRDILKRLDMGALDRYAAADPTVLHIYRAHNAFDAGGFRDVEVRAFLRGLVKQLPQFRVILESTRAAPEDLFPDGEYHVHRVRGLETDAVRSYFRRPFIKNPRQGWELTQEQAQEIYQRLGGKNPKDGAHPLGMSLLAVVADGLGLDPSRVLRRHSDKFRDELREGLFRDLYENVLTPPQQHMLRIVALYRREIPLGHEEALNTRVGDENAFRALEQRFLLSPDEREEHFELHGLFAELARERIAGSSAEYQEDHGVIAEAWLATVRGIKTRRLPYILAANEAAFHLLEAREFRRLDEISATLLGQDTPGMLEAWDKRLFENDDRENRRPVLELLTVLLPREPKYHRFLGETIEKLDGRGADKALEHYLKAFELPPVIPQNLANLGRCYLAREEPERFIDLVADLSDLQRQRAMNAFVHDIHAKCLERMGEGEVASKLRQELIEQGVPNAPIYNDEADYLGKQQRYPEAMAVLEKAERAGVMDEHSWAIKAGILQKDGQGEKASKLRRARIAAGTRDPVFYNDEAMYLRERGELDAALAVLDRAEKNGCTDEHNRTLRRNIEELAKGQS